ncbi:MAG: thioesterase [Planctomyces sp.]|nr:thioesterase [Planctomyces sp.]
MPVIYEHHLTVQQSEIDGHGHVNNVFYLHWMQDAAVAHSREQGWPNSRYREMGLGWVVRTHAIEYLREAFVGEEVMVRTWVADMKKITSLRRYEIVRPSDGEVLVKASTNFVFMNRAAGKIARVPEEVINSFEVLAD